MRCFENIAKLIRQKRIEHPKSYSQSELSHLLGYKNGQFISNVERALCNIPFKMLTKVSEVLNIEYKDLKDAILKDCEQTLENYLGSTEEMANVTPIAQTNRPTTEVASAEENSAATPLSVIGSRY